MPHEDRLGHELDAEALAHAAGDLARERDEQRGRAGAAVGQRERVLARDRDRRRVAVARGEARALDQPGRRGLDAAVGLRPARRARRRAATRASSAANASGRAPGW